MATTDPDSQRYALGCVQIRGQDGLITATDSRQALVQGGFSCPWHEAVLIPSRPVFRADVFAQDGLVQIGRTDSHVTLQAGAWTIAFTIHTEGRFPEVAKIIPAESAVRTRLRLHPDDIRFALDRLDQLPGSDDLHRAVTVDLNGAVALRGRRAADATATELVLRRSEREGQEVRLLTDRRLLRRALDLGFTEIGFTSAEGPAVCRDASRQFVWAVLSPDDAVPPSDRMHSVDSLTASAAPRPAQHHATGTRPTRIRPASEPPAARLNPTPVSRNPPMSVKPDRLPTETELVGQLLALRQQLRAMDQAIVTIARQLRARRKQQQLMKSTLASLKQLQSLGV